VFYYTERDIRCKMMAEGKIIDVAVIKTSHSIHLPKQSHQTKSREFPEHFHSLTNIIFQFKFRLWLSYLLNRAIDSDIKILNREGDRLNYHPLPCDRLNWHMLLNQWEDMKFTWNIIIRNVNLSSMYYYLYKLFFFFLNNGDLINLLSIIQRWTMFSILVLKDLESYCYGV
jgi:hypothetical protein